MKRSRVRVRRIRWKSRFWQHLTPGEFTETVHVTGDRVRLTSSAVGYRVDEADEADEPRAREMVFTYSRDYLKPGRVKFPHPEGPPELVFETTGRPLP